MAVRAGPTAGTLRRAQSAIARAAPKEISSGVQKESKAVSGPPAEPRDHGRSRPDMLEVGPAPWRTQNNFGVPPGTSMTGSPATDSLPYGLPVQ